MNTYRVKYVEKVKTYRYTTSEIKANSKEEALKKLENGEEEIIDSELDLEEYDTSGPLDIKIHKVENE